MRTIQIAAIFSLGVTLDPGRNAETPPPKVSSEALTTEQFAICRAVLEDYIKNSNDSFVCGELRGHGETLLLEKIDGKWKIAKGCGEWVS